MSEYCYLCEGCGKFSEECTCPEFQDPMACWKEMSQLELMEVSPI